MDTAPIVIAPAGFGIPVTEAPIGVAVKLSANGFGLPVTYVASGGMPVITQNNGVNLLTGIPWVAGAITDLTIANGKARATANAFGNPRISKNVTGLIIGRTYHLQGFATHGTASGTQFIRISTGSTMPDGNIISGTTDFPIDVDWVATAASVYVGFVVVATASGQYSEITDALSLTLNPL